MYQPLLNQPQHVDEAGPLKDIRLAYLFLDLLGPLGAPQSYPGKGGRSILRHAEEALLGGRRCSGRPRQPP